MLKLEPLIFPLMINFVPSARASVVGVADVGKAVVVGAADLGAAIHFDTVILYTFALLDYNIRQSKHNMILYTFALLDYNIRQSKHNNHKWRFNGM